MSDLHVQPCEGSYSKSARACTWPCSITMMDPKEEMLGCQFPQFPYIAHSRRWSVENMENNNAFVRELSTLRDGASSLGDRCAAMATLMIGSDAPAQPVVRGRRCIRRCRTDGIGVLLSSLEREPKACS